MPSVLEEIERAEKNARAAAETQFQAVARAIASNDDPSLDSVNEALSAAVRTADDLRAAVQYHQHRNHLRETLAAADDARKESAELNAKIAAANEKLQLAQKEFTATVNPLSNRLTGLQHVINQAAGVKQELQQSCTDAAALARLSSVRAELTANHSLSVSARDNVSAIRSRLNAYERDGKLSNEDKKIVQGIRQRLSDAEDEVNELQRDRERLQQEENELVESLVKL